MSRTELDAISVDQPEDGASLRRGVLIGLPIGISFWVGVAIAIFLR